MAIFTFVEGGYYNNFKEAFYLELVYLPFRLAVVYLNYFYLLQHFLLKKQLGKYIVYTVLSIVLAGTLYRVVTFYHFSAIIFPDYDQGPFWQAYRFVQCFMIITSPMIFLIGLTIVSKWVNTERRAELLEKEKLKAELSYLRSQINPHFFFNTLNNLYGLALQKSDRTHEVVMKLSELMSYILYEADREKVLLTKEIDQIERYIALERIRYNHRFDVRLHTFGDIEDVYIPPLLLLPFIENSFKHGINKHSAGGAITVEVGLTSGMFKFKCSNTISNEVNANKNHSGLGIIFPQSHELKYAEINNEYVVQLLLNHTL